MKQFMTLTLAVLFSALAPMTFAQESNSKVPLPPPAIPAPDNINTYLHLEVNNLTKAMPPLLKDRKLLLTFEGDQQPRYVAAAFGHEAFRVKHLFFKNQNNVYFLVYDLAPDSPDVIDYRLIVDGLWQSDPMNKTNVRNDQGIVLSRVTLAPADKPRHATPEQGFDGQVEFRYHGKPGLQIAIAGNFNNWDPFNNFLEEVEPGEYSIKLTLPEGVVLYQFVVGTRTFLDPQNAHTGHDSNGATFSVFENSVKSRPRLFESNLTSSFNHG